MYSNGYFLRRPITINASKVDGSGGNLTDFIAFLMIEGDYLKSIANGGNIVYDNNYVDIRFELPDGTKLSHDIVSSPQNTGLLTAWIRIPTVFASSDTVIYMYYGKSLTSSEIDRVATWGTSYYRGVYHIADQAIGQWGDSTGILSGHVTNQGTVLTEGSPMLSGVSLNGSSQYASFGAYWRYNRPLGFSMWIKANVLSGDQAIFSTAPHASGGNLAGVVVHLNGSQVRVRLGNNAGTGTANLNRGMTPSDTIKVGVWHKIDVEVTAYNSMKIFVDGVQKSLTYEGTYSGNPVYNTNSAEMGRINTSGSHFNGEIAELRMFNAGTNLKPAPHLLTEYTNQIDPSSFFSVGNQEISLTESVEPTDQTVILQKIAEFVESLTITASITKKSIKHFKQSLRINDVGKVVGSLHILDFFDSIAVRNRSMRLKNGKSPYWNKVEKLAQDAWSRWPRRRW